MGPARPMRRPGEVGGPAVMSTAVTPAATVGTAAVVASSVSAAVATTVPALGLGQARREGHDRQDHRRRPRRPHQAAHEMSH